MSTVRPNRFWSSLTQSFLLAAFVFACASHSFSQTTGQGQSPSAPSDTTIQSRKSDSDTRFGSPENEMRSKAALKEEKKRYEENLGRAREISELAAQLSDNYTANKSFNTDDNKRLERLEKLTKRIRNEAGGSESRPATDLTDICANLVDTMKHLAEMAEDLHKMVDKTPRNVVSAAVIDQANRLITVTQYLRSGR